MAKRYTDEFRRDAVRIATTSGLTRPQLSSDLGVGLSTLNKWVQQHQHHDRMKTWKERIRGFAKKFVYFARSIRVGQVSFSVQIRSSRKRTLARTTSFLMIAVIATFADLPLLII